MSSRRVQYNRDCSVDVSSELEKLRKHYAELQHEKKMKEEDAMAKAMSAKPSETQLRLYKQGVEKIAALKVNEEVEKANDPYALDVRSASPSPICDRLYKEGMMKKLEDLRREQPSPSPSSHKRNVKSSPIHNRLYEEGMQKVRARNLSTQSKRASKSPSVRGTSPNGASERLYDQGIQKLRSRSPSENPAKRDSIDRLYEMEKHKLRATSKNRIPLRGTAKNRIPTSSGKPKTRATSKPRLPLRPGDISARGRSPGSSIRKARENEFDDSFSELKLREKSPGAQRSISDDTEVSRFVSDK